MIRSIAAMLPLALAVLAGCQDRELPTALAPEGVAFDQSAGACVVSNTADSGAGSLRAAIADANCTSITFSVTGQITLTSGELTIARDVKITGPGAASLSVSGNSLSRVFRINSITVKPTVTISGLTITGGNSSYGGGIDNYGTLELTNSTVSRNSAGVFGGGIYNGIGGTLTLTHSTVSRNSTISGTGGGIENWGTLTLTHSTVSDNSSSSSFGGGIYNAGTATLRSTIVANNPSGGNCSSTVTDGGYDLEGGNGSTATTTCGFISGTSRSVADAGLDPAGLADNGGPTLTHALLEGSPAINAGDPDFNDNDPDLPYDQRDIGFPRVRHGRIDVGAFEFVCAAGHYYDSVEGLCVPAPAGHYAEMGAAEATACPLGSYQPATGQTSCLPAPIGSYVDFTGATAAIPCPLGMTTKAEGSTSSKACEGTGGFTFSGFFAPVDNLPTVNVAKAGSAIPVKFSLGGNQGLDIFPSGYPSSLKVNCTSGADEAPVEATVTAGSSSLSYDAATGQYTYVWKTDKAWGGTCRRLTLVFKDEPNKPAHVAEFRFTK